MAEDIIQLDKYRKVMDTRQIKMRMGEGGSLLRQDYGGQGKGGMGEKTNRSPLRGSKTGRLYEAGNRAPLRGSEQTGRRYAARNESVLNG